MGYYGLGPGMKVADRLSEFERALRSLPLDRANEILAALETLTRNIVRMPKEGPHRQISRNDESLSLLVGSQESIDILRVMGWEVDGDPLVLPSTVQLDFQGHVVKIIEAKGFYVKERERIKKLGKIQADPAKAAVAEQIEIDRRERAAKTAAASGNAPSQTDGQPRGAVDPGSPTSSTATVAIASTTATASSTVVTTNDAAGEAASTVSTAASTALPATTSAAATAATSSARRSGDGRLAEKVPSPEVLAAELRQQMSSRDAAAYLHQALGHLSTMPDSVEQSGAAREDGEGAADARINPTSPGAPVDLKQLALERQKRNAAHGSTAAPAEEESSCTVS